MRRELSGDGVGLNCGLLLAISTPLPGPAKRVPTSTHEAVNERRRERIGDRLRYYAEGPNEIDERVDDPECERDIERALESI